MQNGLKQIIPTVSWRRYPGFSRGLVWHHEGVSHFVPSRHVGMDLEMWHSFFTSVLIM